MKQIISLLLFINVIGLQFSCTKENETETDMKEGTGTLCLSGGLYFCAEQIRMDNGDTLIPVNAMEVLHLKSGSSVFVKFQELESEESGCSVGKDCKIIEIQEIE
jgi:hypothetical protein